MQGSCEFQNCNYNCGVVISIKEKELYIEDFNENKERY